MPENPQNHRDRGQLKRNRGVWSTAILNSQQTDPITPKPKHNANKDLLLLLMVLAVATGLWFTWSIFDKPTKLAESDTSKTFFRLKADYTYASKNGPEPLSFNIVAGCGVRLTKYITGDTSTLAVRAPTLYALPMSDGAAVMIETPQACSGATTDNGRVPKDFMPAVVYYEKFDDLSLGLLYASEDAYEGPISKLKLHGATLERATEDEFHNFLNSEDYKRNLVSHQSSKFFTSAADNIKFTDELKKNPGAVWKQRMPRRCTGAMRLKAPEELRKYLRSLRKPGDPKYWYVDHKHNRYMFAWLRGQGSALGLPFKERPFPKILFDGELFEKYDIPSEWWGGGMVTRAGGGSIRARNSRTGYIYSYPAEYYPLVRNTSSSLVETLGKNPSYFSDLIKFEKGNRKGFFYCPTYLNMAGLQYFIGEAGTKEKFFGYPIKLFIDGHEVKSINNDHYKATLRFLFFENDEYIIITKSWVL